MNKPTLVFLFLLMLSLQAIGQSSISPRVLVKAKASKQQLSKSTTTPVNLVINTPYTVSACTTKPHKVGTCTAGQTGCTWTAAAGDLLQPPLTGLVIDPTTECVWGQSTAAGIATVSVTATDDKGKTSSEKLVIQVTPAPNTVVVVEPLSLPDGTVNQPYAQSLAALGGSAPYSWSLDPTATTLPTGLVPDPSGSIRGIPTTKGTSQAFKLKATDQSAHSGESPNVTININDAPDCANARYGDGSYFNGWVPLSRTMNVNPNGIQIRQQPTQNDVVCFYGASNLLAPLTQVQYLYGFGQSTNTLSADLVSIQFKSPLGLQTAVGTSVTSAANTTSGQTSTAAAIATLKAGGNFYLRATYPLFVYQKSNLSLLAVLDPKVGFSFNGFAGQSTLTQGNETYFQLPVEVYGSYTAINNTGGFYFDYRGGLESVPGSFAKTASLPSNAFGLQQLTAGINFVGFMRIGAQRYFGPSAAFNVPSGAQFGGWNLVIQLSPLLSK